jgi:hypothetical protein
MNGERCQALSSPKKSLTTEDTEDTESNIVSRLGFSATSRRVSRYGRTITSLGDVGSWNFTPRDRLDLMVSGTSSDESSIFLFQDPVV